MRELWLVAALGADMTPSHSPQQPSSIQLPAALYWGNRGSSQHILILDRKGAHPFPFKTLP
jgi:hypothetical protein